MYNCILIITLNLYFKSKHWYKNIFCSFNLLLMNKKNQIEKDISDMLKKIDINELDDEMFISHIIGKSFYLIPNYEKINFSPTHKQYISNNTHDHEQETFSLKSEKLKLLNQLYVSNIKSSNIRKLDVYTNVRYFYRYHKLFHIFKQFNVKINDLDVVIIDFKGDKIKTKKDNILLQKIGKSTKIKLTKKIYKYKDIINQKCLKKDTYIRFYHVNIANTFNLYNNILIKVFNLACLCKLGLNIILEVKVSKYTSLIADIINILSGLFQKTILTRHKYNETDKFQIIFHNKIKIPSIKIVKIKKGMYVSRLLTRYNKQIYIFLEDLINLYYEKIMIQNMIIVLSRNHDDKIYKLIINKIKNYREYIDFKAQAY